MGGVISARKSGKVTDPETLKKLHSAARWDKFDEFVALQAKCNLNDHDPGNGNTSIHIAAQNGNLRLVSFLIEKKCDVNVQNGKGQTPLHMAVEYDYYQVIQKLLDNKADPKKKNADGHEALLGIEGTKVLALIAFLGAETTEDMLSSLDKLLQDDSTRSKIDKVELVQIGLKQKKQNKDNWTEEVDKKFKELMALL